ncbi:MAG: hydrogenase maturation protease [Mycobacterium sp.]
MSGPATAAVVIGLGNDLRRDDGVGPAVARAVAALGLPGVRVLDCAAEPTAILDAWTGADLAVLVDAAAGGRPGRVRSHRLAELAEPRPVSSHDLSLAQTWHLGRALGRAPAQVVVVTVDAEDTGHGAGLSAAVAAAVPAASALVEAVVRGALEPADKTAHQQP